ncbi:MAG: SRPBCC family protein [Verrucomicrobia bacterium]|nr:MAG: SRPBCC family protein [Verrucomicrobiota bacterium]
MAIIFLHLFCVAWCISVIKMNKFSIFTRSVLLEATPAEVYAFHEDPRNISKISPSSLKVKKVECSVPARAGEEFRLCLSQFGLPLEWVGFWEEATPDSCLVDGAKKSPFKHWRHAHLFNASGEGTLMTDRVEYAMPIGVLGRLLDVTMMKLVFLVMFQARHAATKAYFGKKK